jgi:hypothetical protein
MELTSGSSAMYVYGPNPTLSMTLQQTMPNKLISRVGAQSLNPEEAGRPHFAKPQASTITIIIILQCAIQDPPSTTTAALSPAKNEASQ